MERADLQSTSPEETERAARAVGGHLRAGDVVLIGGDVGTGKTTFVRAACAALGVTDSVTSPSFTIGHIYRGTPPVAHVDLFRLEDLGGEDPALLDDYLTPGRVAFVEWPGVAAARIEPNRVVIELGLEHAGGDRRKVSAVGLPRLIDALRSSLTEAS